eukprot:CAMPEP_0177549108 /NCGR_PEP_ID=MMETSP0369-20130122/64843_1 /TAXON_ID=447022 ORGANISM="Scrippsiella hangoei-like, Strain SHHI-4" /NCGR_SAMPLE_ID=MMETSP0369 /ASSEMBLY_ACC=CAM_ASM_000364 /LENGTH=51 /DNA_ID=CAMNT_0019034181 /DNA_START=93 /DNA_END=245 /DNA_ORIENTATION=+
MVEIKSGLNVSGRSALHTFPPLRLLRQLQLLAPTSPRKGANDQGKQAPLMT